MRFFVYAANILQEIILMEFFDAVLPLQAAWAVQFLEPNQSQPLLSFYTDKTRHIFKPLAHSRGRDI